MSNYKNESLFRLLPKCKKKNVHLVKTFVYKYKIQFLNERKKSSTLFFAFILHQPT